MTTADRLAIEDLRHQYRPGWGMGLSSNAMADGSGRDYPHDPADLKRCMDYAMRRGWDQAAMVARMGGTSVQWARLTAHWDDLCDLLLTEMSEPGPNASRTYVEMKRVMADGVTCQTCAGTGLGTPCAACKGTGRRSGGYCRAERCYRQGHDFCSDCRGNGFTEREASP